MRGLASVVRSPVIVALFASLAIAGCASKKVPNSAADIGLGAGAETPGSTRDFTVNVGDRIFFDTDSAVHTSRCANNTDPAGSVAQSVSRLHHHN